jgi:hypothetical protein
LLEAKGELTSNPRANKQANELIEKILQLQHRNSKSFAKLYQDRNIEKMGRGKDQLSQDKRLKRAYFG